MSLPLFVVDAFSDRPFGGNPAAVCLLDAPKAADWMQRVASEMNLSETAFVERRDEAFSLRWFTPGTEVALCGHATLAGAHALWEAGWLDADAPARFRSRSGELVARRSDGLIELDLPAQPIAAAPLPPRAGRGLGPIRPIFTGTTPERDLHDVDLLVHVETEAIVRSLRPDFGVLRTQPSGIIVTARASTPGVDFVSRYFAPSFGVDEDPVTGVAHCALAPYWAARLGRSALVGYQASARGGLVRTRVEGPRVFLAGPAATVVRGTLNV